MELSILGINIKRIRESKGMSQADLVRKANVGKATISEIENGKRQSLNSTTINKISTALDVSPEELFLEEGSCEYEVIDIKEALQIIFSSDDLTLNNIALSDNERKILEESINDTFNYILNRRNKMK
ncbi:helix-turn-helix domain-containing protein [Clostridium sp. LY3-2]|uniref:helix-turn-helix domain-containing protein n=1 Tax=Clostridium sp. LY3-2 TaxID=2942482 RepID=UPI0021532C8D|nr:helix-turn-helix domain-containing protein [Clostridium sp. LY3-2]MCR6515336.1 helix-turn-helix domain-containing protein [Clostridium sp. LY3-2]